MAVVWNGACNYGREGGTLRSKASQTQLKSQTEVVGPWALTWYTNFLKVFSLDSFTHCSCELGVDSHILYRLVWNSLNLQLLCFWSSAETLFWRKQTTVKMHPSQCCRWDCSSQVGTRPAPSSDCAAEELCDTTERPLLWHTHTAGWHRPGLKCPMQS